MKRRLDLALALVHSPRVLFLDEPTTGLDPSSRADLWAEVARLAREDGVTVFLTTQYLEEADVLADRVGIIDARPHRRRGHARGAEGGDRPPVGRGDAGRSLATATRSRAVLSPVRLPSSPRRPAPPRCGWTAARTSSAVVRALDAADLRVADLQLHQPSLDDVFLAKTGRKLDAETPRRSQLSCSQQCGEMARRSILQTLRQPAMVIPPILFPLILMGINVGGLDAATKIPGLPAPTATSTSRSRSRSSRARCSRRSTPAARSRATSRPAS